MRLNKQERQNELVAKIMELQNALSLEVKGREELERRCLDLEDRCERSVWKEVHKNIERSVHSSFEDLSDNFRAELAGIKKSVTEATDVGFGLVRPPGVAMEDQGWDERRNMIDAVLSSRYRQLERRCDVAEERHNTRYVRQAGQLENLKQRNEALEDERNTLKKLLAAKREGVPVSELPIDEGKTSQRPYDGALRSRVSSGYPGKDAAMSKDLAVVAFEEALREEAADVKLDQELHGTFSPHADYFPTPSEMTLSSNKWGMPSLPIDSSHRRIIGDLASASPPAEQPLGTYMAIQQRALRTSLPAASVASVR